MNPQEKLAADPQAAMADPEVQAWLARALDRYEAANGRRDQAASRLSAEVTRLLNTDGALADAVFGTSKQDAAWSAAVRIQRTNGRYTVEAYLCPADGEEPFELPQHTPAPPEYTSPGPTVTTVTPQAGGPITRLDVSWSSDAPRVRIWRGSQITTRPITPCSPSAARLYTAAESTPGTLHRHHNGWDWEREEDTD